MGMLFIIFLDRGKTEKKRKIRVRWVLSSFSEGDVFFFDNKPFLSRPNQPEGQKGADKRPGFGFLKCFVISLSLATRRSVSLHQTPAEPGNLVLCLSGNDTSPLGRVPLSPPVNETDGTC